MAPMDVSVLVPVLNERRHLYDVVVSMQAQTFRGAMEFLFIDGGSTDGSREIIAEMANRDPRIRLLDNPNGRTPRALNLGLQAAAGEFVVRMDAHAHYRPNYIADGVARLKRGDVISVSGPQLAVGYDDWSRRVALVLGSPLGTGGARFRHHADEEFEVDSGFTGIWRRSVLLANGGWDDEWIGDEDFEMAARLRKAGGRIVCIPEMAAEYAPRNSLPSLARQYWAYGRARVRTSRRHPESLRPSQLLPSALVLTLILADLPHQPLARPARAGVLLYLAGVVGESVRAARRGARPSDAAAMPVVFITMHVSFGVGGFAGLVAYGAPWAALAHAQRKVVRRVWPVSTGTRE
jgi:succinoglycan biosynthesis protein ExoA